MLCELMLNPVRFCGVAPGAAKLIEPIVCGYLTLLSHGMYMSNNTHIYYKHLSLKLPRELENFEKSEITYFHLLHYTFFTDPHKFPP